MESTVPDHLTDGTELLETLGWHPEEGFRRLDAHLARMARSAAALGFRFARAAALEALATLPKAGPLRVRLALKPSGEIALTHAPLTPTAGWTVHIAAQRLRSDDLWLRHKTTRRATYDAARAALPAGVEDAILLNERGEVCESTIANIFLRRDRLLTPPLSAGLLPGVLRASLLASGAAVEARLSRDDLQSGAIFLGNSLRGLIPARLV